MAKRTLYFEIEDVESYSSDIWTAQAEENGWKVLSPKSEELGFIYEGNFTYEIYSELLGLRGIRRNTIEKAVNFIAFEWRRQERLKEQVSK